MQKGRLVVIEGLDGSGKETQSNRLFERLSGEGLRVRKVDFPRYDSPSSALVKMYLNGDFGDKAKDISPYVASTFYAVDRFASFKQDWESFLNDGGIVLADRYTTSNMIHQAGKIEKPEERIKFLDWLTDYEFNIFKLPQPDCVIFLDMPPEFNAKLMKDRKNKFTGEEHKDIHERDKSHLEESYNNAVSLADSFGWLRIPCVNEEGLRKIEDIHEEVYRRIKEVL